VTVQPHASRPPSHATGCVGFWLWALVGTGIVFGLLSFLVFVLIPMIVIAILLARRSQWNDAPSLVGMAAGAGLPLLVVAGLNWSDWHHRTIGDGTPNPYDWGGVGVCLLVTGIVAYALLRGRRRT
jgi:hypothetical protein